MTKKNPLLNKIERHVEASRYTEALTCFSSHINELLSAPNIKDIYKIVARIPRIYFTTVEHKLMYGWLCLEVGNSKSLRWVLSELDFSKVKSDANKASYLALSSMSLSLRRPEKGLYITQRALTYFSGRENSLTRANIHYNYAKQLSRCMLFFTAAKNYDIAGRLFEKQGATYFAILAYVDGALNNCYAGKYNEVISKYHTLFANELRLNNKLWDLLKLPIAICYYNKNQIDKCLKLLLDVKKIIKRIPILHYHSLLMQYLFKVYLHQKKVNDINNLIDKLDTSKVYQTKEIKQLIAAIEVEKDMVFKQDIEKKNTKYLELVLSSAELKAPFFLVECLFKLKLEGKINGLKIDYFITYFNRARDIGNASHVQSMALYLADIYHNKGDIEKSKNYLEIADKAYRETDTIINFFNRQLLCLDLLKEIDEELFIIVKG